MRLGAVLGASALVIAQSPALRAEPNHPALRSLLPLVEVYAAGKAAPAFDVAGIRCAALLIAQHDWAQEAGGDVDGPGKAGMQEADRLLEASEQQRLNDGIDLVRAHVTIERETARVLRLYTRQFRRNAGSGRHPWEGDALLHGDLSFCAALTSQK
jgi:hypothetical protein